jgi:hypothetical protein
MTAHGTSGRSLPGHLEAGGRPPTRIAHNWAAESGPPIRARPATELATRIDTTWIDHHERGAERPFDHAALIADFDLEAR